MTEAAEIATEYAREQSDERIADRIAVIDESGTQVLTLSDEVRNKITEKLKNVYDSIQEAVLEDIYNTYLNAE